VTQSVAFFSDMGGIAYDAQIVNAVPPYPEMLGALISSIHKPADAPLHVLELGCGTGNVAMALSHHYHHLHLTVVDLSEPMLTACQAKVAHRVTSLTPLQQDFLSVEVPPGSLDVVISSLALHHLTTEGKQQLYQRIAQWLKPGGVFRCADLCQGVPDTTIMADYWRRWEQWSRDHGASQTEIDAWLSHCRTMDQYDSLFDQLGWLQQAGLQHVDAYWRTLFWTVFGGEKPA
jgi:tRNA (cmo5U34)-methyltransferase